MVSIIMMILRINVISRLVKDDEVGDNDQEDQDQASKQCPTD